MNGFLTASAALAATANMKKFILPIVIVLVVAGALIFSRPEVSDVVEAQIFEGNDFVFEYTGDYVASDVGLWSPNRYDKYLNPKPGDLTSSLADIEVYSVQDYQGSIEDYLVEIHQLEELDEGYETVNLREYEFGKLIVNETRSLAEHEEYLSTVNYVTQQDGLLVIFRVFSLENDNDELREMISSLRYKFAIYTEEGFSFKYPTEYTRGPQGLWLNDRYEYYLKPRLETSSDLVPDVNVYLVANYESLEKYLQVLYFTEEVPVCEDIQLGEHSFCYWENEFKEYSISNYVMQLDDQVLIFRSFFTDIDQQELQNMISTLQF